MAHCCVPLCTNDYRYAEKGTQNRRNLSFHVFPKDEGLKKRWIIAIRRDEGPHFKVRQDCQASDNM